MKLLLIIGFAAFAAVANAIKDPCMCTREYIPVCGTDGTTYGNKCMLNCEKQTNNIDLEMAHEGPCDEHQDTQDVAEKHCACPLLWAPLCGTNGRTYTNECVFKCHQYEDRYVEIAHSGVCEEFPTVKQEERKKLCICTMEWRPVCGTNGKTYGNICGLNCEKRDSNPDLEIAYEGTCNQEQFEEPASKPCPCPFIYRPVCGTDGRTYPNECVFECNNRQNQVKIDYYGRCNGFQRFQQNSEDLQHMRDPCACDRVLNPVCGSDGKTYNNRCLLRCAKLTIKPGLEQIYEGPCAEEQFLRDPCLCTREYNPVCGSDGTTYPNPCTLRCAAANAPELSQVHMGPCEEQAIQMRDPCICPRIYMPVCGNDGKTYGNPCTLRCAASKNPQIQQVHFGECDQEIREEQFRNPCVCNKMLRPVCGSDGRTYSNPCRLNCVRETKNNALRLVHFGACKSAEDQQSLTPTIDMCKCALMLLPICGSDGKTYANPCELKCHQLLTNKNLELVHMGPCRPQVDEEAADETQPEPCTCNKMYLPVCGTDGVTYANPCLLNCAKRSIPGLRLVRYGPCVQRKLEEFDADKECACNRMYFPVCGTDGKTYVNPCLLNCAQKNGKPELITLHEGECKNQEDEEEDDDINDECYCGDYYSPVCARQGDKLITFTNVCRYSCAARNNPNLSFEKHTACNEDQVAVETNEMTTFCTLEYAPVCGTDGHTYGNLCFFKAAARRNQGLSLAHRGACEENTILAEENKFCNCPENIWKPVCGTDLHTYPNMCEFKCAVKQKPDSTNALLLW